MSLKPGCCSYMWTQFANEPEPRQCLHSLLSLDSFPTPDLSPPSFPPSFLYWLLLSPSPFLCHCLLFFTLLLPQSSAFLLTESLCNVQAWFLYSFIPGDEVSILHLEKQMKFFTFYVFLSYHSGLIKEVALFYVQTFSGNDFFFCVWRCWFLILLPFHVFLNCN